MQRAVEGSSWTVETYLQAKILDALNGANWQRSGGKGQPPAPTQTPADTEEAKRKADAKESRAREQAAKFAERLALAQALEAQEAAQINADMVSQPGQGN